MSCDDYVRQLQQVNEAIKSSTGDKKDDLISLKNSIEELLALTSENGEDSVDSGSNIDDEYAQFMAEINDEHSRKQTYNSEDISENDNDNHRSLEGKKCRAPHVNKWGSKGYHNAMICSILNSNEVRILFTNPTQEEMLPCPYYFETDCKFTDDKCKYSHGEVLPLSELQDYVEPSFESLRIGSEILAKKDNNLWARAKIKRILNNTCMVKFESTKKEIELPFEEILPLENDDCEDSSSGDSSEGELQISQDTINLSLMNVTQSGQLGEWEKFTKGIGSKLMQKMGYVVGTGLGKKSDGRLDPVTAVILPAGKSLDHCMNLREKSGGDKDLFAADKKMKRRQKRQEILNQRAYERELNKKDVFQFLNDTLTTTTDDMPSCSKSQHKTAIKKESCRSLNVAGLKIDGNIRKIERDIFILKESLARHKDINSQMHKNLQQKLKTTLEELSQLKNQAENIKNEQNFRKDKRKLTVF